jgi:hypothetical protein
VVVPSGVFTGLGVFVDAGLLVGVELGVMVAAKVGISTVGVSSGDCPGTVASGVPTIMGTVAGAPRSSSGKELSLVLPGSGVSATTFPDCSLVGRESASSDGELHANDMAARSNTKISGRNQFSRSDFLSIVSPDFRHYSTLRPIS